MPDESSRFHWRERYEIAFSRISIGKQELQGYKLNAFLKGVAMEFICMWLFILVGVGSAVYSGMNLISLSLSPARIVLISFAFGFAIFVLVSSSAAVSGGHLNPAVTLGMMATGNVPVIRGLVYIVTQMIAACIGAACIKSSIPQIQRGTLGSNMPNPIMSDGDVFGMEFLGTFVLVWTVFATAVDPRGPAQIAPFCIGMAVFIAHLLLIPVDGCSINPARSFGTAAVSGIWTDQFLFWIGPIMGGLVAAVGYAYVFLPTVQETITMRAAVLAGADKMEGFGGDGVNMGKLANTVGVETVGADEAQLPVAIPPHKKLRLSTVDEGIAPSSAPSATEASLTAPPPEPAETAAAVADTTKDAAADAADAVKDAAGDAAEGAAAASADAAKDAAATASDVAADAAGTVGDAAADAAAAAKKAVA